MTDPTTGPEADARRAALLTQVNGVTETTPPPNPARVALATIGGLLLVGGGVFALVQKSSADQAARVDYYSVAFGNPTDTAGPAFTGMWVAVVVAGVGALMLIGLLVAMAAQRPR